MKSYHLRGIAGNCKLRGKRDKLLSCKCCVVQNFKQDERDREAVKEIEQYRKHPNEEVLA